MKSSNYISIKQYLDNKGIHPVKDRGYYGMYCSPLRNDSNPSFKVDYDKDLWYDFGANEGGSIVDLVMKLENCSLAEAFRQLENSFSFHRNDSSADSPKLINRVPTLIITDIQPLMHPALLDYLKERSIDIDIVKQHCREINYTVNNKPYYGIGFRNHSGGYEIRNPYFKGCIAPKDISHIKQAEKKDTCYLFEGFIDYLSFLTLRKNQSLQFPCSDWQDYIVLNSTANLPKAMYQLAGYENIHCFLDNDTAGKAAYKELEKEFGLRIRDASRHYSGHKDLNDFLCAKNCSKIAEQNRVAKPTPQPPKRKNRGLKI